MALFKSRFTISQIEEAINRALNIIVEGKTYINRGAWQSGGSYSNTEESIDYVIYNGMSYFCLVAHSGQTDPPDEDTTNWAPLYAYEPFLKNAPEDEIDDSDFLVFVDSSDDERTKKISWADIKEMLPIDIDQPIEMRATDTYIQWRYVGTADWTNLIAISEITGPQGPVEWENVIDKPDTFPPASHNHPKSDVGLGNVDNVKQMPIAGGTFTGKAYAQSNTDYTTAQIRNIVLSTSDPSGGNNGDIWIKYS